VIPYINPVAISASLLGAWVALALAAWIVARVHRAVVGGRSASEPALVVDRTIAPPSAGRSRAA
jgi:hypothetical protein